MCGRADVRPCLKEGRASLPGAGQRNRTGTVHPDTILLRNTPAPGPGIELPEEKQAPAGKPQALHFQLLRAPAEELFTPGFGFLGISAHHFLISLV